MREGEDEVEAIAGTGPSSAAALGVPEVVVSDFAHVRAVTCGPLRLVVVGECAATETALRAALGAVAAGRWAELTAWPGSYWVIADRPGERLVCGDLAGVRGVFYRTVGDGPVRWASRPHLLATRSGTGIDLGLLTARIVLGEQHWPRQSPFTGVHAVPGGYGLHLTAGGGVRLVEVTAPLQPVGLHEGAGRFGQALQHAVELRMQSAAGPVGADLSGGLDSSTAVLLAARWGEVRAVTYTDPLTSAEDTAFAARVAEHAAIAHQTVLGADTELPFAFPSAAPCGDEPVLDMANTAMDAAYLAPVAGLRAHLTGHGGDVVLDSSSACLPGLLQAGQRRRAHRAVVAWARHRNTAPGPVWKQVKTAADGYPRALEQAAATLERGPNVAERTGSAWSWLRLGTAATWPATCRACAISSPTPRWSKAAWWTPTRLCAACSRLPAASVRRAWPRCTSSW